MAPEASNRRRCQAHGLMYDPQLRAGCVLCRREAQSARPAPQAVPRLVPASLTLVLLAGLGVTYAWPGPHATTARSGLTQTGITGECEPELSQRPARSASSHAEPTSASTDEQSAARQSLPALQPLLPSMWAEVAKNFVAADPRQPGVQALLARGIGVHVPQTQLLDIEQGKVTGIRPAEDEVHRATVQVSASLARYSASFLERAGFRHLVLIGNLKHKGLAPGAFAMSPAGAMIANPSALVRDDFVQHEFFHFMDYRLYGFPGHSEEWLRLNPGGTRYGQGGREMVARNRGATARLLQPLRGVPGFVTRYAQADPMEDRAEVFALLMAHSETALELASSDPFIASKMHFLLMALDRIEPGSARALGLPSLPAGVR